MKYKKKTSNSKRVCPSQPFLKANPQDLPLISNLSWGMLPLLGFLAVGRSCFMETLSVAHRPFSLLWCVLLGPVWCRTISAKLKLLYVLFLPKMFRFLSKIVINTSPHSYNLLIAFQKHQSVGLEHSSLGLRATDPPYSCTPWIIPPLFFCNHFHHL